jgi:DNA-binding MarR family transcriptional regulator
MHWTAPLCLRADHITARSVVLAGEPFRPAVGNTKTAPLPFSICVPFFGLAIATKALIRSVHSLRRSHRVRIAVGMIAACRSTATVETAPESKTVWVGRSTFEVSYRDDPRPLGTTNLRVAHYGCIHVIMTFSCYCTMARSAARRITALYDETLAPTGVNVAQFALLKVLEQQGEIALTQLGDLLELDRSTIGRNVRVMEKMSLLVLKKGADQRVTTADLTKKGRRICNAGTTLWDKAQSRITRKLGRKQAFELRALLGAL